MDRWLQAASNRSSGLPLNFWRLNLKWVHDFLEDVARFRRDTWCKKWVRLKTTEDRGGAYFEESSSEKKMLFQAFGHQLCGEHIKLSFLNLFEKSGRGNASKLFEYSTSLDTTLTGFPPTKDQKSLRSLDLIWDLRTYSSVVIVYKKNSHAYRLIDVWNVIFFFHKVVNKTKSIGVYFTRK